MSGSDRPNNHLRTDVRELIVAQDNCDKPALIIMDGVGIGQGVYQDLTTRQGLKHIMPSGSMQKENIGGLKVQRFHAALLQLYDGLVRIPETMPGLEVLLSGFSAFPDAKNDDQVDAICNWLQTANSSFERPVNTGCVWEVLPCPPSAPLRPI